MGFFRKLFHLDETEKTDDSPAKVTGMGALAAMLDEIDKEPEDFWDDDPDLDPDPELMDEEELPEEEPDPFDDDLD